MCWLIYAGLWRNIVRHRHRTATATVLIARWARRCRHRSWHSRTWLGTDSVDRVLTKRQRRERYYYSYWRRRPVDCRRLDGLVASRSEHQSLTCCYWSRRPVLAATCRRSTCPRDIRECDRWRRGHVVWSDARLPGLTVSTRRLIDTDRHSHFYTDTQRHGDIQTRTHIDGHANKYYINLYFAKEAASRQYNKKIQRWYNTKKRGTKTIIKQLKRLHDMHCAMSVFL